MDFDLSDDHRAIRQATIDFAKAEFGPLRADEDVGASGFHEHWKRCAAFGIQAMPVPGEYGGSGSDPLTIAVVLEALGYGCQDNGLLFSLNAHMWSCEIPIARFGSEEQKRQYLPGLADGSLIGVQAMTEPDSGSDALGMRSTARRDGDRYVLDGAKTFITNAPIADVFVVFVKTDEQATIGSVSAFLVRRDADGIAVGPPMKKMGLTSSPMSEVVLSGCEVDVSDRLAAEGAGLAVFNTSMTWERSLILATAVGTMQRQLETCIGYAKDRKQFDRPIGSFQAVSHRIADMRVRLDAARLLLYRQAWAMGRGRPSPPDSSIVKLFLSEAFVRSSEDAMAIHGGAGYLVEAGFEREMRDALGSRVYSGTSDIQRNIIAGYLGL